MDIVEDLKLVGEDRLTWMASCLTLDDTVEGKAINEILRLRKELEEVKSIHADDYNTLKDVFGHTQQFKAFELAKIHLCGEEVPTTTQDS